MNNLADKIIDIVSNKEEVKHDDIPRIETQGRLFEINCPAIDECVDEIERLIERLDGIQARLEALESIIALRDNINKQSSKKNIKTRCF